MAIYTFNMDLTLDEAPCFPKDLGGQSLTELDTRATGNEPPKIYWAQNVLPTREGVSSVIYQTYISDPSPVTLNPNTFYTKVHTVYDSQGKQSFYYYSAGTHVVLNPATGLWSILKSGGSSIISYVALVHGRSIIFEYGAGVYEMSPNFTSLQALPLAGVSVGSMNGMGSALDYLLLWDNNTIYWSAPGAPTEFRPVVNNVPTGAGSAALVEALGPPVYIERISGGFIIYCRDNIVGARYSGNSRNPWIFRGLDGGSSLGRPDGVYAGDSAQNHFVFTYEGLKLVNLTRCENLFPNVDKFLKGYTYYKSNGDGTFTAKTSKYGTGDANPAQLVCKCAFIGDRYFCISYGDRFDSAFDFILIYNVTLETWGHVAMRHVDVFEFKDVIYASTGSPTDMLGPGIICVLTTTGQVRVLKELDTEFDGSGTPLMGEIIWGECKLARQSACAVNGVHTWGALATAVDSGVAVIPRREQGQAAEIDFVASGWESPRFVGESNGLSHQLHISGAFLFSSVQIDIANWGRR